MPKERVDKGTLGSGWYWRRNQSEWRIRDSVASTIAGGPYADRDEAEGDRKHLEDALLNDDEAPLELWERQNRKWRKETPKS